MGPENMKPGVFYIRNEDGTWSELAGVKGVEMEIPKPPKYESDDLQFTQPDWSASLELKDPIFPFALLRRIFGFRGAVWICFNRWRFRRKLKKHRKARKPVVIGNVTAVEHSDGGVRFTVKRTDSDDCKL